MTKVTTQQENITLSVYADNNKHSKQKQKQTELETCKSTVTVGDFNIPLSATYRTVERKKSI